MKTLAFLLLLAMISCAPGRVVKTETADDVNFQNFRTFDFYKLEASGDTVSSKFTSYTELLKAAVARELSAKGYRQSADNADLLVNMGIVVKEERQTRETNIREAPRYIGQRRYSWKSQEVEVGRYKSGTVTIDLVDSKNNKMVWEGVLEGIISQKENAYRNDIDKAITNLFDKFPD